MTLSVARRLAVLLAAGLATMLIALALYSPSASAVGFCGGQVVGPNQPCFGAARNMSIVTGSGRERSICVGANNIVGPCSSGPGAIASRNFGFVFNGVPFISANSAGLSVVFGETF